MSGWIVKYDGPCSKCGTLLRAGTEAVYDRARRKMLCVACPPIAIVPSPAPIEPGVAGASARREYARRVDKRETERRDRWGSRIGGLINRFADEPQSIRAWRIGAVGEERLGKAFPEVPGLILLNDRKVRGTKGNIDHIVIAPAGVFVVDAKHWEGMIRVVDRGGFFSTDLRLTVGGRDRSKLADNMEWQVKAVIRALSEGGVDPLPQVTPVLCFVDGSWPIFRAPKSYNGVLLESDRSIVRVLSAANDLDSDRIESVARVLAASLPSNESQPPDRYRPPPCQRQPDEARDASE